MNCTLANSIHFQKDYGELRSYVDKLLMNIIAEAPHLLCVDNSSWEAKSVQTVTWLSHGVEHKMFSRLFLDTELWLLCLFVSTEGNSRGL